MTAAWELEAAAIAASPRFTCDHGRAHTPADPCDADPAGVINGIVTRAITAHFQGNRGSAQHGTWVAARLVALAANPNIGPGVSLTSLIEAYGAPPPSGIPAPMTVAELGDEPPVDDAPLPKRARKVRA